MRVGFDKDGKEIYEGYVCSFVIDGTEYEGMVKYDEDVYSYVFEMPEDNFPCVTMSKVDYDTISVKYTKDEVLDNDEVYVRYNSIKLV